MRRTERGNENKGTGTREGKLRKTHKKNYKKKEKEREKEEVE